jgi:hypothetical protein
MCLENAATFAVWGRVRPPEPQRARSVLHGASAISRCVRETNAGAKWKPHLGLYLPMLEGRPGAHRAIRVHPSHSFSVPAVLQLVWRHRIGPVQVLARGGP